MNLWWKWFGKWEVESESFVTAHYGSIFKSLEHDKEVMLVIEKNSKTGKKRAYIKDISGSITSVDMDFVKKMLNQKA